MRQRDILGHLDTGSVWRDRQGDTWRFKEWVGWCWSREGEVSDEPDTPTFYDGPYVEIPPPVGSFTHHPNPEPSKEKP